MATKKKGSRLSMLSSVMDDLQTVDEPISAAENSPAPESISEKTSAHALHSSAQSVDLSENIGKQFGQRFDLSLPVSGGTVSCVYAEVSPSDIEFTEDNFRVDELMTLEDPDLHRLYESISQAEDLMQRDPILLAPGPVGGPKYIGVWGKSRTFVIQSLRENTNKDWKLRAWVGPVPERDVFALAESENDHRRNLSVYERARKLKHVLNSKYSGLTHTVASQRLGVSVSALSEYLAIARIPVGFVALLSGPALLTYRDGIKLSKLLSGIKESDVPSILKRLSKGAPYDKSANMIAQLQTKPAAIIDSPIAMKGTSGKGKAASIKPLKKDGEYQITLKGFSEKGDIERFKKLLREF